jgi:5'-nucleotidase
VGGAEALAATVASLRASNPSGALLLDAGDSIQGSLVSNTFEGRPVRELLEQLGYAAVAIGNHEFDFGPRGPGPGDSAPSRSAPGGGDPTGALKAWIGGARFKALAANIIDRSTGRPVDWPNLQPTAVIERAGVRVGVIGVTTPATEVTTMPAHVSGLRFSPMLEAVRRHAARLRASGVGVVVVLAHAGGSCGRSCSGEIFSDLLDHLRPGEVDAVIAGHTHRGIWRRYRGIPVVEACSRGVALARVDLEVDRARNRVVSARGPARPRGGGARGSPLPCRSATTCSMTPGTARVSSGPASREGAWSRRRSCADTPTPPGAPGEWSDASSCASAPSAPAC